MLITADRRIQFGRRDVTGAMRAMAVMMFFCVASFEVALRSGWYGKSDSVYAGEVKMSAQVYRRSRTYCRQ